MNQQLQREREGAYVVTFSLCSLTTTASWERGGDLTTYEICVIRPSFYGTLVMIQRSVMSHTWVFLRCVPTLGKLSLILNTTLQK